MSDTYLIPKFIVDALLADLKDLKRAQRNGIQNINKRIDEIKQRVHVLEAERVE